MDAQPRTLAALRTQPRHEHDVLGVARWVCGGLGQGGDVIRARGASGGRGGGGTEPGEARRAPCPGGASGAEWLLLPVPGTAAESFPNLVSLVEGAELRVQPGVEPGTLR